MFNSDKSTIGKSWLYRRIFWNVKAWHALAFVGFYFLFGFLYWLALYVNSEGAWNSGDQTIVSYGLRALLSLPIYWLIFVKMSKQPLLHRLLVHIVAMPAYLVAWLWMYHRVCDFFDIGYLFGQGLVWDIYIPFLLYSVQFGFLHFYEYVSRSEKLRETEHELRQLALESEVSALKAQLQPHFLFNTLNSISASVPPQMEHTRELIAQLADTFRFGLQASQSDRVPLRDEVRFLKTYLDLEKQRFDERLNVDFRVGEELLDHSVPPMLLQPLVENAIKHGVGRSVEPVTVSVSVSRVGKELEFAVSDTGTGYDGKLGNGLFSKGIGLRNTKLRLEKRFGRGLYVKRNEPQGLTFWFKIPLEN